MDSIRGLIVYHKEKAVLRKGKLRDSTHISHLLGHYIKTPVEGVH